MASDSDLPIYNPVTGIGRREAWKLRSMEKRIHFIPLILLLCFLILWILGSKICQENTSIKDEEIGNFSIEDEDFNNPIEIKKSESLKEMNVRVDLAMLSLATTPMNASDAKSPFQETPEFTPSAGRVTQITDPSPGSSVSTSFGLGRVLLQEENVTITDEKINELSEIKKPESVNETSIDFASSCSVAAQGNASSGSQQLLQANPEISPLQSAGPGHQK